jgi:putative GTP pyrophosphokinase
LKIAQHFFNGFQFESHKVDGFTQEIIGLKPDISRGKFNFYMRENISKIKRYQECFEKENQNDKIQPLHGYSPLFISRRQRHILQHSDQRSKRTF